MIAGAIGVRAPQQEVAGEVHARDSQPGAARDLEVHHREADGDAGAAVEDLVQEAVARIVVVLPVAAKPELVVEVLVERAQGGVEGHAGGPADPRRDASSPIRSSSSRYGAVVERRILHARDREGRRRQALARRVHRMLELVRDFDRARVQVEGEGTVI